MTSEQIKKLRVGDLIRLVKEWNPEVNGRMGVVVYVRPFENITTHDIEVLWTIDRDGTTELRHYSRENSTLEGASELVCEAK